MRLSTYVDLSEMTKSDTAKARGIENTPDVTTIAAMGLLCRNVIDKIREHFGKPLTITSGFRCMELEKAISGVTSKDRSQHVQGLAADFVIAGVSCKDIFKWIIDPRNEIHYDQCILEKNNKGAEWIHVSYGVRRMAMLGVDTNNDTIMEYLHVNAETYA